MMVSNMSLQAPESSFSGLTERSLRSDKVAELGKRLVQELGLENTSDTLSRWLAQPFAELIGEGEGAEGEDKKGKAQNCRDEILKLWDHRHSLSSGKRPFEDLEPIFRALASLDPENTIPRYFRLERPPAEETQDGAETRKWLA